MTICDTGQIVADAGPEGQFAHWAICGCGWQQARRTANRADAEIALAEHQAGHAEHPGSIVPVARPNTTPAAGVVRPVGDLAAIEDAFTEYIRVCTRLLEPTDFQRIGDKDFRKKSAWRKLAVAFGVSCHMTERVYERDQAGRIIRAEVVVRATAPNGRFMDGLGACDIHEKCCAPDCRRGGKHRHCAPNCSGAIHFSNASHDLPATAATRATNRACADLFGMGEVSAEEIVSGGEPAYVTARPSPAPGASAEGGRVSSPGPGYVDVDGVITVPEDRCPECNGPAGKHATKCSRGQAA